AVAVQLHGVGEIVVRGAGKERIVRDVHWYAHAIHGEGVMQHSMCSCVVMIFSHDVMPLARRKSRQGQTGCVPALQAIVVDTPAVAGIVRLPGKVVDPSIQGLLAFELDRLWQVLRTGWNVEVKFVGERDNRRSYRRVLLVEVAVGKRDGSRDGELRG